MVYSKKILKSAMFFIAILSIMFNLGGCANTQPNPVISVLDKCKSQTEVINWSILQLPSRGVLADGLSTLAVSIFGNDAGFEKDMMKVINGGEKNIAITCRSSMKLKSFMSNFLENAKNGQLKGVNFCVVGADHLDDIVQLEQKTQAKIQWYE